MNRSTATVSEAEVAAFRRDGVVCLRQAFDREWIAALVEAVERDKAAPGPMVRHNTPDGVTGEFFVDFQLWRRWPECRRFVEESPAAAIAARLLGASEVVFYHDHLLVKEPNTPLPTPWHHDQPYYPVDGRMVGSIWLPLDPVDRATSLEFVAGSHRWGRWFRPRYFNADGTALVPGDDGMEEAPDVEAGRDEYEILGWEMVPGDCLFFHALTLHGAAGNASSTRRRRAYATRWLGEDARYAERPGRVSPPIEGHGLKAGDPMACELFPVVWPRSVS
ncbi:MAG: phytanoyl-CoA dioxygenase family protein [Alphaproteobacteria bacterium]|jgi:ectoine hydroxylase-related dioxygenase (phytanoyl-CoA dioxygenase family)|nr:phytanoyl-CoA dioxygenase family protein [Alphaproteobacteria bacterium]